jgi:N-acetylglucosamine kinase
MTAFAPCVVAVDGGGTQTRCVVAALDGAPLGRAAAGPSNLQRVGAAAVQRVLEEAIAAAARDAATPLDVRALCLALAGAARPDDVAALRAMVDTMRRRAEDRADTTLRWTLPPDGPVIVNDAVAALAGGTGDTVGVVAIAGTGSIVFGRNAAGQEARSGGWGYILGDEGSGYAIGLAGVRAVCRAADGRGPATLLTQRVCEAYDLAAPAGLVSLVYGGGWGPPEIAAVAPLVVRAAGDGDGDGDAVAQAILAGAAAELALAVRSVVRRLALDGAAFPLVTSGGVWAAAPGLVAAFTRAVHAFAPGAAVAPPRDEPVMGAVLLARRSLAPGG